jgi:uncharacterized protein YidB (DUF937 family)
MMMGLLDTILGMVSGKSGSGGDSGHPLGAALSSLLEQNGGVQGLMTKFSEGGLGEVFSSWVGMGANKAVSGEQISALLGSEQVQALASNLGIDPAKASDFLADYLPKIIDKLTPTGELGAGDDQSSGLAALLPSLLSSLAGGVSKQA